MGNKSRKSKAAERKRSSAGRWMWTLVAVLVLFAAGYTYTGMRGGDPAEPHFVKGGETRPVLDPRLFTGNVFQAYLGAMRHGEAFDQVYCYCRCDRPPFNHKSLLSCFADYHAAG